MRFRHPLSRGGSSVVERESSKLLVAGSSPAPRLLYPLAGSSEVERGIVNPDAGGSIPPLPDPCCESCGDERCCDEATRSDPVAPLALRSHLVASCENKPNFAWQAALFAFSAIRYARRPATLVVHTTHRELHPWFHLARERAGAVLIAAPSFRGRHNYGPRNTAGTLVTLADVVRPDDTVALCDADLVFTGPFPLRSKPGRVIADFYPVVRTDNPIMDEVIAAYGLDLERWRCLGMNRRAGVPYLIRGSDCRRLGEAWAEAIDAFGRRPFWEAQMTAFAMAAEKCGLLMHLRRTTHVTYRNDPLQGFGIHYGWRCEGWFKHDYYGPTAPDFWASADGKTAPAGTLMDHLFRQIRECRAFYGM